MAEILKVWIWSGAGERHSELDGETVPVAEDFSNGLMYPGDPGGEPDETAGCACSMDIITSDGKPVQPAGRPSRPKRGRTTLSRDVRKYYESERGELGGPRSGFGYWQEVVGEVKLTEEEKAAILAFDNSSVGLQRALRAGKTPGHGISGKYLKQYEAIESGLSKHELAEDQIVWRGIGNAGNLKVGSTMIDNGFLVTSTSVRDAASYARTLQGTYQAVKDGAVILIDMGKGTRFCPGSKALSEIIFDRGSVLEITGEDVMKIDGVEHRVLMARPTGVPE